MALFSEVLTTSVSKICRKQVNGISLSKSKSICAKQFHIMSYPSISSPTLCIRLYRNNRNQIVHSLALISDCSVSLFSELSDPENAVEIGLLSKWKTDSKINHRRKPKGLLFLGPIYRSMKDGISSIVMLPWRTPAKL